MPHSTRQPRGSCQPKKRCDCSTLFANGGVNETPNVNNVGGPRNVAPVSIKIGNNVYTVCGRCNMKNIRVNMHTYSLLFVLVVSLVVWPQMASSTPVNVRATLSATTIYLGDSVQLELRVEGVRDLEPPEITHPDIDISQAQGQSYSNSSLTIVQGKTTRVEEFGYVVRYELRPRVAGTLTIPAITVTHGNDTYTSQPFTLVVQAHAAQDRLLVEVTTDKPSYVVGETVTVTLDISIRALMLNGSILDIDPFFPKQPPHVQIPWFDQLGDWKTSDVATFAEPFIQQQKPGFHINDYTDQGSLMGNTRLTFTLPRQTTQRTRPDGTFTYYTYRLQKTFRPIRAGSQTIPAVLVKASLPTQIDAQGRAQQIEKLFAGSQPLPVSIHPVPSDGRPASFSGGVGRFRFDASASPTSLKVGDPLTLTLTVHGEKDSLLETVRPPRLQDQPAIAKDFKLSSDPPTVLTATDTKTFTYTLRPRHEQVRAVPPIAMAYYDPVSQRFQEQHSQAIPLQVTGAPTLKPSAIVTTTERQPAKSRLGQQLADGLLANYTGPKVLTPQQAVVRFTPLVIALLAFPPGVYFLLALGRRWHRKRQQAPPSQQRSKRAAHDALSTFRHLQKNQASSDADVCEAVYRGVMTYLSDKLDVPNTGLTAADVMQHLHMRNVDQETIDQAATLFGLCDSVRYTPGTQAVAQATGLLEAATTFVKHVEAHCKL